MHRRDSRPAGRRAGRALLGAVAAALCLVASACTAVSSGDPAPQATARGIAAASSLTADIKNLFEPGGLALSEFRQRHPGAFAAADGRMLLEAEGVGAQSFEVSHQPGGKLTLSIYCQAPGPYELAVFDGEHRLDRTWSETCEQVAFYTTRALDPADLELRVTMPAGVGYRVDAITAP